MMSDVTANSPQQEERLPFDPTRRLSAIFFVIAAVVLAGIGSSLISGELSTPGGLLWLLLPVPLVAIGVRSLRAGVLVNSEGFTSRSEFMTVRIGWEQVDRFVLVGVSVGVLLKTGRVVALQQGRQADAFIGDLQEAQRRWSGGH